MKNLKKILIFFCLFFLAGGVLQAKASLARPSQENQASQADWLITVEVKQAVFKHVAGNRYTLTIPTNKVGSILFFTDRSARRAFSVNPTHFKALVEIGQHLQQNDPPNISLVFAKNQASGAAFTMMEGRVSKNRVVYQLTLLGKALTLKEYRGPTVVFVDGFAANPCSKKTAGKSGSLVDSILEEIVSDL